MKKCFCNSHIKHCLQNRTTLTTLTLVFKLNLFLSQFSQFCVNLLSTIIIIFFFFSICPYSNLLLLNGMYICSFLFWLFYFIFKKINNLLILFNHSHDNLSIDEIFTIVFCWIWYVTLSFLHYLLFIISKSVCIAFSFLCYKEGTYNKLCLLLFFSCLSVFFFLYLVDPFHIIILSFF